MTNCQSTLTQLKRTSNSQVHVTQFSCVDYILALSAEIWTNSRGFLLKRCVMFIQSVQRINCVNPIHNKKRKHVNPQSFLTLNRGEGTAKVTQQVDVEVSSLVPFCSHWADVMFLPAPPLEEELRQTGCKRSPLRAPTLPFRREILLVENASPILHKRLETTKTALGCDHVSMRGC